LLRGIVINAHLYLEKGIPIKPMEVQSNENAALLKLLKTRSRTKTELLKVSGARRRARQAALDALLAEGKIIRIDKEYFANDPSGSVEELIHAEAVRLDAYLRSVPEEPVEKVKNGELTVEDIIAKLSKRKSRAMMGRIA
jgi:hypothetical protein